MGALASKGHLQMNSVTAGGAAPLQMTVVQLEDAAQGSLSAQANA